MSNTRSELMRRLIAEAEEAEKYSREGSRPESTDTSPVLHVADITFQFDALLADVDGAKEQAQSPANYFAPSKSQPRH